MVLAQGGSSSDGGTMSELNRGYTPEMETSLGRLSVASKVGPMAVQGLPVYPDGADIDGTDETIVLYDGSMTDDAVVALIDQITADVIILALDTCHSGGFARDFLTRPGRIGLFSSDEDVLSDTAEPLLAGGYLSYALRQAVLGHADAMPRDGALFAGELTDFMHRQFVAHHEHINPEGSHSPMQWLVARRGSVLWTDPLWLYPRSPDGSLRPVPDVRLDSPPAARRQLGEAPPVPPTCP